MPALANKYKGYTIWIKKNRTHRTYDAIARIEGVHKSILTEYGHSKDDAEIRIKEKIDFLNA